MGARWYAVALLTAPLLMIMVTPLALLFPEFLPRVFTSEEKASLVLFGIAMGLMAGIFEELGWTGFAVPTLRLVALIQAMLSSTLEPNGERTP